MSLSLFTSESVTEGHPDKVADQVSDAVVDAVLARDPRGRVACETLLGWNVAMVAGELRMNGSMPDVAALVRRVMADVGYRRPVYGEDGADCVVRITRQSKEIADAVDGAGDERSALGAGDQGMMFGYACDDTPELMPAPIAAAHALVKRLTQVRRDGTIPWLRPDGKSQVTYEYDEGRPVRIAAVVLSAQHDREAAGSTLSQEEIRSRLVEQVVAPALDDRHFDPDGTVCHVNPSGSFVAGGPGADAGLTGRKIVVDTYGGMGRHGGGAFSGKDASKVDRSGAYAARWAAKNLVAAGAASRCEVRLAYAIGRPRPVQVWVDSFGTGKAPDAALSRAVREIFDFRPGGIIRDLGLDRPVFLPTAAYGHLGRRPRVEDVGGKPVELFRWERTDKVDDVRSQLGL